MRLDIISNDDDWVMVYADGQVRHSGHSIPSHVWSQLVVLPITSVNTWLFDFEAKGYPSDRIDFSDPAAIEAEGLTPL